MMLLNIMFSLTFMVLFPFLASAGVIAERKLPKGLQSPIAGYAVVEPIFEGSVFGKHFKLSGTVSEVYTQLEKVHGAEKLATELKHTPDTREHEKRNKIWNPLCVPVSGQNWAPTSSYELGVCSNWLRQIQGRAWVNGRSCARICANGGAEAWVCNDRYTPIEPANAYLGSYVDDIRGFCKQELGIKVTLSGGQMFDTDNYNVIARRA